MTTSNSMSVNAARAGLTARDSMIVIIEKFVWGFRE
jgi:hypothetical protein